MYSQQAIRASSFYIQYCLLRIAQSLPFELLHPPYHLQYWFRVLSRKLAFGEILCPASSDGREASRFPNRNLIAVTRRWGCLCRQNCCEAGEEVYSAGSNAIPSRTCTGVHLILGRFSVLRHPAHPVTSRGTVFLHWPLLLVSQCRVSLQAEGNEWRTSLALSVLQDTRMLVPFPAPTPGLYELEQCTSRCSHSICSPATHRSHW